MTTQRTIPDLEAITAHDLAALLADGPAIGAPLPVRPHCALFASLERFIPAVLARDHAEWTHESIDALSVASAVRTGEGSIELLGTCSLHSDQTVTPFALTLALGEQMTIGSLGLKLGEPGGGPLGISGPGCTSVAASTLLAGLPLRVNRVDWTYELGW